MSLPTSFSKRSHDKDSTSRSYLTNEGDDEGDQSPPKSQRLIMDGPPVHTGLTGSLGHKLKTNCNGSSPRNKAYSMSCAQQRTMYDSSSPWLPPGHAIAERRGSSSIPVSTARPLQSPNGGSMTRLHADAEVAPRCLEADLSATQQVSWNQLMEGMAKELSAEEAKKITDRHPGASAPLQNDILIERALNSVTSSMPIKTRLKEKWGKFVGLVFPFR